MELWSPIIVSDLYNVFPTFSQMLLPFVLQPRCLEDHSIDLSLERKINVSWPQVWASPLIIYNPTPLSTRLRYDKLVVWSLSLLRWSLYATSHDSGIILVEQCCIFSRATMCITKNEKLKLDLPTPSAVLPETYIMWPTSPLSLILKCMVYHSQE